MGCKYICDGCGKEKDAVDRHGVYIKPAEWFQRSDKDGIQIACDESCIAVIAEKTGKTKTVLSIF